MPSPPSTPLSSLPATGVLSLLEMLGPATQAWIKDRQGRYQWVNRAFLLNYSLEHLDEVVGQTDADLSPAHLADQYRSDDELVLAGGKVVDRVELVGRFDHTASWSITNKVPLHDARGRLYGTAGTTRAVGDSEAVMVAEDARLSAVVAGIRANVSHPLETAALAKMAGLSVRAFERRFRQLFHMAPQQYVRRLRVRLACQALVFSSRSLAEVADDHGFCDQSHFTREFRKETGMTPREYQQRYGTTAGA
ncbi:AraC family transcriptional regulator [Verrucomicrobium sp. BvORR106]|uniref:AraC family transcriptional regulator n=1 Tax=Verrucomicrobium sp. BvORR106 TaxID=1403819 RepID=UPI00068B74B4|nr:AraC family transcriptional regulator [Verrucomicrobium sp. BvORR106]